MPDFAPLFLAAGGKPIDVAGQLLHAALEIHLAPASTVHVLFESSVPSPVQGLAVSAVRDKHRLTVAGTSARHLVLWRDTAPSHIEIALPPARLPVPIRVYNVWRDAKYGTTMHGLNAAAMRVTNEATGKWLLECSDGWGTDADFSDLVVRLIHEPSPISAA